MPALPTDRTLRRLARFRSARDGVLSLYVSFDPAGGARRDVTAVALDALHALSRPALEQRFGRRLVEEREALDRFLRRDFRLEGRSLIVFSCRPRGLWETFQLRVPVRPLVRFAERPVVAPLAAALDEHERYAVVLLDKEQARIIDVHLGGVERRINVYDQYPGRTAMGGWAQARYERHRDVHLHRHVLHVAEALQKEGRRHPFDRLVVGGP
ncbi:MAG: Vms1/Ankzf1 family peptidyl-tRNA hydrolase, partial [Dehalococcoidia bacterium]|nr:Vms1/Ankzf1 family peptidyl-tRNA hydrolase [Dehalococcoidia bacterium]